MTALTTVDNFGGFRWAACICRSSEDTSRIRFFRRKLAIRDLVSLAPGVRTIVGATDCGPERPETTAYQHQRPDTTLSVYDTDTTLSDQVSPQPSQLYYWSYIVNAGGRCGPFNEIFLNMLIRSTRVSKSIHVTWMDFKTRVDRMGMFKTHCTQILLWNISIRIFTFQIFCIAPPYGGVKP